MLSAEQRELLEVWLPGHEIVEDLTWDIAQTTVHRIEAGGELYTVKAGTKYNNHIGREITAHETVLRNPVLAPRVPRFIVGSRDHRIFVTTWIPGQLIDDSEKESDPEVLFQAGQFLRALHDTEHGTDETLNQNLVNAAFKWLDKAHAIEPDKADQARELLESYPEVSPAVVSSHGDYSGRNWLWTGDGLAVIDFGRFGHRPASHDFIRMFSRRWRDHPKEAEPFFQGYGREPADVYGQDWWYTILREAVATACWAHAVDDREFEAFGLRFIDIALKELA